MANPSIPPNRPAPDWPIALRVSNDKRQTILECKGKIKAAELRAVVMMPGVLSSDDSAIPRFLKSLMGREVAEIQNLDVPDAGVQILLDLTRMDDYTSRDDVNNQLKTGEE
jgi:hypothetical protein